MIRSSSLYSALSRICNNGIHSSLLVTKDGELLGSCIGEAPLTKTNKNTNEIDGATNGIVSDCNTSNPQDEAMTTSVTTGEIIGHDKTTEGSQNQAPKAGEGIENGNEDIFIRQNASSNTDLNLNPKDIGALVAETLEDYKRLGYELGLLNPVMSSSKSSSLSNSRHMGDRISSSTIIHSNNGENSGESAFIDKSNGENIDSSSSINGNLNLSTNETMTNPSTLSRKERGRLYCLILELDEGIIGIASATSNTFVVALAEEATHQGMMKGRLEALASYIGEAFGQLE